MVCVPCIILPVILAIYLKFIQPFIIRFVPDAWKAKLDLILYPTCSVQLPSTPLEKKSCCAENSSATKLTPEPSDNLQTENKKDS